MTEKEREIDIKEAIFDCLLHWRWAILLMIIGAVLAGAFGFYKSYKGDVAKAEAEEMTAADYLAQIQEEEKADNKVIIKKQELATIEQTINLNEYLYKTQGYRDFFNYSNFDVNNVPTYEYIYAVKADDMKSSSDLVDEYSFYLDSNDFSEYVKSNTSVKEDYLKDLVKWSKSDATDKNTLQFKISDTDPMCLFRVQVIYKDEETCRALADAVNEYVISVSKALKKESVKHEFICLNEGFSYKYNNDLVNVIKNANDTYVNNSIIIGKNVDAFSEEGRKYYDMRLTELEVREEVARVQNLTGGEPQIDIEIATDPKAGKVKSVIKSIIKYALVGAVGFAFVYFACIVVFKYVLSNKINAGDDLAALYGVTLLGEVNGTKNKKKFLGFIDKLLIKLRDANKRTFDLDKSIEITSGAVKLAADKNELKEIIAVGSDLSNIKDLSSKLYDKLASNVKVVELDNILYDAENLSKVSGKKGAIIIAVIGNTMHDEIAREIEILKSQEINILGIVTVNV